MYVPLFHILKNWFQKKTECGLRRKGSSEKCDNKILSRKCEFQSIPKCQNVTLQNCKNETRSKCDEIPYEDCNFLTRRVPKQVTKNVMVCIRRTQTCKDPYNQPIHQENMYYFIF